MSTSSRKRRVTIITDTAQHLGPYLAEEISTVRSCVYRYPAGVKLFHTRTAELYGI